MKKAFAVFSFLICISFICACGSSDVSKPPVPPAPKPDTYEKCIAVAAKKADYYIRLAFDLADGYLSIENVANTNPVAARRYGDDMKYANSLNFTDATTPGVGKIRSNDLGGFEFWYLRADSEEDTTNFNTPIDDYSGLEGNITNPTKRNLVVARANIAGWSGAKRYELSFLQTDTPGKIDFDIQYSTTGAYTSQKTLMRTPSFSFTVENSSGIMKHFDITITNLYGKIHPLVSLGHMPSANDLFVIENGTLLISGTDTDTGRIYTITLNYVNDEVTDGEFKNDNGTFSAKFTATRTESYYILDGDTTLTKHYVLWDYPL